MPVSKHYAKLEQKVTAAVEEAALTLKEPWTNLVERMNTDEDLIDRMDSESYLKIKIPSEIAVRKREKASLYFDQNNNQTIKYVNVKVEAVEPLADRETFIRHVVYLTRKKGIMGTLFRKPKIEDENLSKEVMISIIMKGFAYCRNPNRKEHPYLIGEDDVFRDDVGTFGIPVSDLGTPLDLITVKNASGLRVPWRYIGTEYSVFPIHIEDHGGLISYNENVFGSFKLWIIIRKEYYQLLNEKMREHYHKHYPGKQLTKKCLLLHKNLWIDPELMIEWGIEFKIVVQRAGEAIFTGPNAFHEGFNGGVNLATSVNLILNCFLKTLNLRNIICFCRGPNRVYANLTKTQYTILEEYYKKKNSLSVKGKPQNKPALKAKRNCVNEYDEGDVPELEPATQVTEEDANFPDVACMEAEIPSDPPSLTNGGSCDKLKPVHANVAAVVQGMAFTDPEAVLVTVPSLVAREDHLKSNENQHNPFSDHFDTGMEGKVCDSSSILQDDGDIVGISKSEENQVAPPHRQHLEEAEQCLPEQKMIDETASGTFNNPSHCSRIDTNGVTEGNVLHCPAPTLTVNLDLVHTDGRNLNVSLVAEISTFLIPKPQKVIKIVACETCGKKFSSTSINRHRLIHVKDTTKFFKCNKCNKSFKTKDSLRHHQSSHDESPSFVCELCGRAFKHLTTLCNHKKRDHK